MHNPFKTQKIKHLMLAMGPRDLHSAPYSPVHCSSHSMTSFQSSELTEVPAVENSQLFAQRAHSARYAPIEARQSSLQAQALSSWGLFSWLPRNPRGTWVKPFCGGLDTLPKGAGGGGAACLF